MGGIYVNMSTATQYRISCIIIILLVCFWPFAHWLCLGTHMLIIILQPYDIDLGRGCKTPESAIR